MRTAATNALPPVGSRRPVHPIDTGPRRFGGAVYPARARRGGLEDVLGFAVQELGKE